MISATPTSMNVWLRSGAAATTPHTNLAAALANVSAPPSSRTTRMRHARMPSVWPPCAQKPQKNAAMSPSKLSENHNVPGGTPAPKEHPRCGSQLIAPMVASSLAVNVAAAKAPAGTRGITRLVGTAGAIGGSVEVFSWVARNPDHPLARLLARPGFELQRHLSTAEPSDDQLEVANAGPALALTRLLIQLGRCGAARAALTAA